MYRVKGRMIRGNKPNAKAFGDRLRASRMRLRTPDGRRFTQAMLATVVGVERNTVARWENASMLPRDPTVIAALSRALNVSADWLLGDLVTELHPSIHEQPMQPYRARLGDAESLPPKACDLALRYLERMASAGCERGQTEEAERFLVAGAKNQLVRIPFESRDVEAIMADIDTAWDFVVEVMRRQGIRL